MGKKLKIKLMEWENPEKSNPNPPNLWDPSGAVRGGRFPTLETPCPTQTGISSPLVIPGLISAAFPELLSDQDPDVIASNRLSWSHVTSWNSWAALLPLLKILQQHKARKFWNLLPFVQFPFFPGCCSRWDRLGLT